MLAFKPRIETAFRIILTAVILFNALAPVTASAMQSSDKEEAGSSTVLPASQLGMKGINIASYSSSLRSRAALEEGTPTLTETPTTEPTATPTETITPITETPAPAREPGRTRR